MSDIRIENVRLSFPSLLEPSQFNEKADPVFKAYFLIAKDDPQVKLIKAAMLEAANERWGENGKKRLSVLFKKGDTCLRDGDEKVNRDDEVLDGYGGCYYIRANNAVQPLLLDRNENEIDKLKGKDIPYAGCFVHTVLNVWAQDSHNSIRVNAKLLGVMFAAEGEPFGSGPQRASASAFAGLSSSDGELDEPDGFDDDDLGF